DLSTHGRIRRRFSSAALWPAGHRSISSELHFVTHEMFEAIRRHEEQHNIGFLTADLKTEAATGEGNHRGRTERPLPCILLAGNCASPKFSAESERGFLERWNNGDTFGFPEDIFRDVRIRCLN